MNRLIFGVIAAVLSIVQLAAPARAQQPLGPVGPGPEAAGRAGADVAVASEATALQTNPAGLARQSRNRSDMLGVGAFNKLDLAPAGGKNTWNGDQALFSGNFAYAFMPSKLNEDPLARWKGSELGILESLEQRSRYDASVSVPLAGTPSRVEVTGKGVGFWVSDIVLRGRSRADSTRMEFALPTLEPLPSGATPSEVAVKFEYTRSSGESGANPSLTVTAFNRSESMLLKGEPGQWHGAEMTIVLGQSGPAPGVRFIAVTEPGVRVGVRAVSLVISFGLAGKKLETRSVVADDQITSSGSSEAAEMVVASLPGLTPASSEESTLWLLDDARVFKGEELTGLQFEFRYGFEGAGSTGLVLIFVDGKELKRVEFKPRDEEASAGDLIESNRQIIEWAERDRIHFGFGIFTTAMWGAGFSSLPSDIGVHEGQLRYLRWTGSIGAAVDVHPAFSIGAAIDLHHGRFLAFDGVFPQSPSILRTYEGDYRSVTLRDRVSLQVDGDDLFGYGVSGRLGVMVEPAKDIRIGAVFSPPGWMDRHKGSATVDLTDDFEAFGFDAWLQANASLPLAGDTGYASEYEAWIDGLRIPLQAGLGFSVKLGDALTVALDLGYTGWSNAADGFVMRIYQGRNANADAVTGGLIEARIPFRMKDQYHFALGVSLEAGESVTFHAGYRFATDPVVEGAAHPMFPGGPSSLVSLGVTVRYKNLAFHVAAQHGFDTVTDIGSSGHAAWYDGSSITQRSEYATIGISYEY